MIRARDLPELRARSVQESKRVAAQIAAESNREVADANRRLRDAMYGPPELLRFWELADLFYVSDEMSELAGQAMASMPGFNIHPEDLPSEFGLICLQSADLSEGSHVISVWGPDYNGGVAFASYGVKPDDILLLHRTSIPYGQDEIPGTEGAQQWARVVRCCWLLMQQRVATVTEEKPDRASSRRIVRQGRVPEPVRVISLRYPEHHGATSEDGRTYHHRWVVRGHWRKQWYGSQDRHVPIWISPHVKGPDGAPLLGGEKVYAWTR